MQICSIYAQLVFRSQNTRVVIREAQPGRPVTWTGPGFMRVSEGDSLIFEIPDIPMSMEYEIVIRYEAQVRLIRLPIIILCTIRGFPRYSKNKTYILYELKKYRNMI